MIRRDIPVVSRWVSICPLSFSSWRSIAPLTTSSVSSLCRWYCRLSISPLLIRITLPRYLSVTAKRFSQPQGFLTISDKLAQPELLFQRRQQLLDPLLRRRLAVDADQRFGAGKAD